MKTFYSKFIPALMVLFVPFLAQAQISGPGSVCTGASISLSDAHSFGSWSSSDVGVANVDGGGNVFGINGGVAEIYYNYTNVFTGGNFTDSFSVTVNTWPNAGSISGTTNTVCQGQTISFTDGATGGSWSSSDNSVATVDGAGNVTGVSAGSPTIYYIASNGCGTVFATTLVFVNPLPDAGTITGNTLLCGIGAAQTLNDGAFGGSWSSSDATVATVDGSGNIISTGFGAASIYYTTFNDCGSSSANVSVHVNPQPDAISSSASFVCEHSTINLTDDSTGGTWLSANPDIATIDPISGKVSGIVAGNALITYILGGGCYSIAGVLVNPLPHAGTITGTTGLSRGGLTTLFDAVEGGVWHSCNSLIASVDEIGNVTGVADGSTLISYSVTNICGTVSALATVIVGNCTPASTITTFAGSHVNGYTGDGGPATAATMGNPYAVAADGVGNVYIADYFNNAIRRVDPSGIITTIAGTGVAGYNGDNIPATSAQLNGPIGVTLDGHGNIYIADKFNERVRMIDASGVITTIAGTGLHGGWQGNGYGNEGPATSANLDFPASVALDCAGNIYIADLGSQTVRRIDPSGNIHLFAGTYGGGFNGDAIPANTAQLNAPTCVAADCAGNVYIADSWNNRVRMVNAAGIITTVAGNGAPAYAGDGTPGGSASLWIPNGITLDACGDLYICDWQNNVVRVLSGGYITTFAGVNANDWHGYDGDGGAADSAFMYLPASLAIDGIGNIYIADYGNNVIREVSNTTIAERTFANGTTQDITVCESTTTPITSQMGVADAMSGKTETWTVSMQPAHGTLTGFNASATSRAGITTPSNVTYTPAAGYTGTDAFTIVMNDGTTAASTTVNVKITPTPNAGAIVGGTDVTNGNTIALADPTGDKNGVWSSSTNLIATVDQSGNVTGAGNGIATISYTVTNGCGSKSATTGVVIAGAAVTETKALLYPNPNNGSFQYEFMSENAAQYDLTISDVAGRIVYKQSIDATAGANVISVNLPANVARPSMYTVQLGNKNTKFPVTKITVTE